MLKENVRILFQGDSVTDAFRTGESPSEYGLGYPRKIKEYLDYFHADQKVQLINRGISGNRVRDLKRRWQEDCIAIKPDILSILIGVNDTWRRYDSDDPTSALEFEKDYREILSQVKSAFPCKLVLLEPFLIPVNDTILRWREDLDPKIHVVRRLAKDFDAVFIPLDGIFAAASAQGNYSDWSLDGVHPTDKGHALIAKEWLNAVGGGNL